MQAEQDSRKTKKFQKSEIMVMYDLMFETLLGQTIVLIGAFMGLIAAIDSDWDDAWHKLLLSYNRRQVQVVNRIAFTIGVVLCLFLNFPSREHWSGEVFNFILFPFIGIVVLCLTWCLIFNLSRFIRWAIEALWNWWFE